MAKSADYLDPNRNLNQEQLYYAYLATQKDKITLRNFMAIFIKTQLRFTKKK
jgi:hypothetical protein